VRHLEWRVRVFGVGAVLALAGIYLRLDWLVNVALVVLVTGFLLRFLPDEDDDDDGLDDDDGDDDDGLDHADEFDDVGRPYPESGADRDTDEWPPG
jgi:hypothetical protein